MWNRLQAAWRHSSYDSLGSVAISEFLTLLWGRQCYTFPYCVHRASLTSPIRGRGSSFSSFSRTVKFGCIQSQPNHPRRITFHSRNIIIFRISWLLRLFRYFARSQYVKLICVMVSFSAIPIGTEDLALDGMILSNDTAQTFYLSELRLWQSHQR
ncbi:hypothetical protein FB567DRAFT_332664 [Paraphoma chrysanthemicola]|uniref:Uncharacterized protein n=1 Tax=Paraphoma chrysanthemicola TaxID=798071 RepID=A0A8K0VYP7_9PLEO|nr:hypothetical protein FB567DRAFT_332664 [Paraphoma chrysanthemicola]